MKKFYVIWTNGKGAGLFSNVFHVLGHLMLAEERHMIPVVDMENYPTLYNDMSIQHTKNAWEYYFKQVSEYSLEEVYASNNYTLCSGEFPYFVYDLRSFQQRIDIAGIIDKYITIQDDVMRDVESFWNDNFYNCREIVGVHFRGWEMLTADKHPKPPNVGQITKAIYSLLDVYPEIDKVFLSTEQQDYVDYLKSEFGELLVLNDEYFRSKAGINSYNIYPAPRDKHIYRLGREVLIDMVLLSRCDYFIASGDKWGLASGSNVSLMAQLINNRKYKKTHLIYNGAVNVKDKIIKKMVPNEIIHNFSGAKEFVFCGYCKYGIELYKKLSDLLPEKCFVFCDNSPDKQRKSYKHNKTVLSVAKAVEKYPNAVFCVSVKSDNAVYSLAIQLMQLGIENDMVVHIISN